MFKTMEQAVCEIAREALAVMDRAGSNNVSLSLGKLDDAKLGILRRIFKSVEPEAFGYYRFERQGGNSHD